MKAMKRTVLVGISMFALVAGVSAQTVNNSPTTLQTFQADWQQTNGVTTMTPALYEEMKTAWMNSNVNTFSANERVVPVELTAAEKQVILDAEKRQAMGVPSDYPLLQDTGNPSLDADNYHQAKVAWIQNNPAAYSQMISTSTLTESQRNEIRQQEINNQNP
ncbi:MAG: hypothetical protein P8P74_01105 [Crocinitomicaceae bacterium]|nr:hypothetical protein [Crocinitomicaceae bacterium]